jgi:dephospho-CoA kinase
MIRIGLTGSIGMGKSAVSAMFRSAGVPVFDADAAVHDLQGPGGALLHAIEARFPGSTSPEGVNRQALGAMVLGKPGELHALEHIVHPAVGRLRERWLRRHRARPMVVLDIPLLLEKGGAKAVDIVVVVSAPHWLQRKRVLARAGMTPAKLRHIRRLQTPDHEKRRRADFVIETGRVRHQTAAQVRGLIACLRAKRVR